MKLSTEFMVGAAGLAVLALVVYNGAGKTVDALKSVGSAIDPTNNNNVFATGVNKVGGILAGGDPNWSLGGAIYDWTHSTPTADAQAPIWKSDENGSLLSRYPNPTAIFDNPSKIDYTDPTTWSLGL